MKSKTFDFNTREYDKLSISQLKRQADYWLRQYLLKTNEREFDGLIKCPLKNQWYQKDRVHVSHFIDRQCMELRYDLDNCHLISEQSNMWEAQEPKEGYKSKHHYDYEQYLGSQIVEDLRERSKIIKIFQKEDYIEVIEKFRGNE